MTTQEIKNKMVSAVSTQSTKTLKECAQALMSNFEDGAGVVFVLVLDELEKRMTAEEYSQFCESL